MLVYITKYALERGVLEANLLERTLVTTDYPREEKVCYICTWRGQKYMLSFEDIEFSLEAALHVAEDKKEARIQELKDEIRKLEQTEISVMPMEEE